MPDQAAERAISCLQHAIEDAQGTIRAYDSKAEILGVLLTVALGITNFTLFPKVESCSKLLLIASWGVGLIAIGALGLVLYPKKGQFRGLSFGTYAPSEVYFLTGIETKPNMSVSELTDKALTADWVAVLTYENMKLSMVRDSKHQRFVLALPVAALTIALIALTVIAVAWGK